MNDYPIISVSGLNTGYTRNRLILDRLNLSVSKGAIYGFLGVNGAGKSTTIRTLLGLLAPHSGSVRIFGKDIQSHRLEILSKIGSLIESPSLYKHLSGEENVKIACKYLRVNENRISEVLDLVNLSQHRKKLTKNYSTGMKQRLGLGIALLSDPELLILDEPTNGLDPSGIIEIRKIIQRLHQTGKTILLSSHLLSEIEKIATQVGIIKNGTIIFEGTIHALEQLKDQHLMVKIITSDNAQALSVLSEKYQVEMNDHDYLNVMLDSREQIPDISKMLHIQAIKVYEVSIQKNDLENLFINLTENSAI